MKREISAHPGLWKAMAATAAAAVLALALAGCTQGSTASSSASPASAAGSAASSSALSDASNSAASASADAAATGFKVNIDAPAWDELTCTPMIAAVEPVIEGVMDSKPLYFAVAVNEPVAIEVDPGAYRVTFISGVDMDGSIYTFPQTKEVTAGTLDDDSAILDVEATLVAADNVTPEQMEHVVAANTIATQSLDNVSSDGSAILENVIKNAQNAPEVPVEEIQSAQDLARNAIENGEASDITLNTPPQNLTAE